MVVFQRLGATLLRLDDAQWEAFQRGLIPLPSSQEMRLDVLLLSLRGGVCELIDPVSVRVDGNGYLRRLDVDMDPLPHGATVQDARPRFVYRFLQHAGRWSPSEAVLRQSLELAGAQPLSARAITEPP